MPNGRLLLDQGDAAEHEADADIDGHVHVKFKEDGTELEVDDFTVLEAHDCRLVCITNADYAHGMGGRHDCVYRATIDEGPIAIQVVAFDTNPNSAKDTSGLRKYLADLLAEDDRSRAAVPSSTAQNMPAYEESATATPTRGSHSATSIAADPTGTTVGEFHCRPQPLHVQWCSMSPGRTWTDMLGAVARRPHSQRPPPRRSVAKTGADLRCFSRDVQRRSTR
jgi:hypothetical protein